MKIHITFIYLCCCSIAIFAQNTDLKSYLETAKIETESAYGMQYRVYKAGQGEHVKKGDYVLIHYKGKLLDGTIFDATEPEEPFVFQVGYGQVVRGLDVGMTLLNKGSKTDLFIPSDMAYGTKGVGKMIPPNAALIFEVDVIDIMDNKAYDQYMRALEAKERAAFEAHIAQQFETDLRRINDYAVQNKIKAKRLPSGLSYAITKKGKGEKATSGDVLEVSYEGFLLDGTTFDKSPAKEPYQVRLGAKKVIQGWEEGLQQFNKGAQGWLLVPSKMAYGPRSIEEDHISIPSDAVLIFKIKVESIK